MSHPARKPTVIRGAKIVDGSGAPAFDGDLLIHDGGIEAVEPPGKIPAPDGAGELDAKGKTLTPGFIDVHSHSDYYLVVDPRAPGKIMQGVTTEIGGNCGYCPAPIAGALAEDRRKEYDDVFQTPCPWHSITEYRNHLDAQGLVVNYLQLIGHNTIRASVMGGSAAAPDADQLEQMCAMVRTGMREGAYGFSLGLVYAPGCYSRREELIALVRTAHEEGGYLATHMRDEGNKLIEAIEEVIDLARATGIPLQVSHLKTSGPRNWHKAEAAIRLIEDARGEGLDVEADRYPYTASYTSLSALLPDWALEGTREEAVERLRDMGNRKRMAAEIAENHPEEDYWERVRIGQMFVDDDLPLEGRSIAEIAGDWGCAPFEALADILMREQMMGAVTLFAMSAENMLRFLSQPWTTVGSDAAVRSASGKLAAGKPHPRAYGTFPRFLRHALDNGWFSLEEAVAKMTGNAARRFQIKDRGLIRPGYAADLVLLDLPRLRDTATFDSPQQYPLGVDTVWVNGVPVVHNENPTGAAPGRWLTR